MSVICISGTLYRESFRVTFDNELLTTMYIYTYKSFKREMGLLINYNLIKVTSYNHSYHLTHEKKRLVFL